jgi:hypothetical protein
VILGHGAPCRRQSTGTAAQSLANLHRALDGSQEGANVGPANRHTPGHGFSRKNWLADKNHAIIFPCAGQPRVYSRLRANMDSFLSIIMDS